MISKKETDIKSITKNWIEGFVLLHNLCPFARRPFETDSIYYEVTKGDGIEGQLKSFYLLCDRMLQGDLRETSTSFYIFDKEHSFDDLIYIKGVFDEFLNAANFDTELQTVAFHPDFQFEDGSSSQDPGHYVNRSPYGMIHLIRSSEMNEAVDLIDEDTDIPNENKLKMENIGQQKLANGLLKYTD